MLLSSIWRRAALLLFVIFAPLETWGAPSLPTKEIEVRIEPNVTVSGERIVLGDVATIYAKSMRNFRELSDLVLSQIPEDQGELRLPESYLNRRIREVLPPGVDFALHAPKEIVFRLERLGFSSTELVAELSRQAKDQGKIPAGVESEIELISGADQLKLFKPDAVRVEAAAQMPLWRGEISFKVVPKEERGVAPAVAWVKARVRWYAQVWVAKSGIAMNQSISSADFERVRRELTSQREEALAAETPQQLDAMLSNARVRRPLTANDVLSAKMIDRRPDAHAGAPLKVVFVSESGIRVTTDGSLLGTGVIGGDVKVKLKSSRKIVTGKLVSSGLMEVSL